MSTGGKGKAKGGGKGQKDKQQQLQDKSKPALQNPSVRRISQSYIGSRTQLDSKGRLHAPSRGPKRRDDDIREGDEGHVEWMTAPQLVKPDDQLELSEQELKEEITRVLTANNPHTPSKIIRFSHKEQSFKPIVSIDQMAIHFTLD
ncbi:PREDICTED: dynein intermediate chain 2, ciliary-like, partial [Amphimedon queenslandica]